MSTTHEKHASSTLDRAAQAVEATVEATVDLLYRAPLWLPNNHAQTIVPALFGRRPAVNYRRERWDTPDGDFIDVDWLVHDAHRKPSDDAPLFVLFHGLEGSSTSHYALALTDAAHRRGWHAVVPHFRSCSGPLNLLPRFYHLADSDEVDWILHRLKQQHGGPVVAGGVSLGCNVLLRWLCERESEASIVDAAVAISAPLDVHAGGQAISQGFGMV